VIKHLTVTPQLAIVLQSVDQILKKMRAVMLKQRPVGDCHGVVARTIQQRRNPDDRILFFGEGNYVAHSILLDKEGHTQADVWRGNYKPADALYVDHRGKEFSLLSVVPATRIMQ
jgi:hypothetical protein